VPSLLWLKVQRRRVAVYSAAYLSPRVNVWLQRNRASIGQKFSLGSRIIRVGQGFPSQNSGPARCLIRFVHSAGSTRESSLILYISCISLPTSKEANFGMRGEQIPVLCKVWTRQYSQWKAVPPDKISDTRVCLQGDDIHVPSRSCLGRPGSR
jgi:hypothetical protein